jgi:hypothetical protein
MSQSVSVPPASDSGLPISDKVRRGVDAKFTDHWHDRDGIDLPSPVLVVGTGTALERWEDKRPSYITAKPLPNPDDLNATIPKSQWETGLNGQPEPPWKKIYVFYFVDPISGSLYTYKNSTWGTQQMFDQLMEQMQVIRMLRRKRLQTVTL